MRQSDGSSFGINFQLERSNAGYVFDGVEQVLGLFSGQPMYSGNDDTYYNMDTADAIHPPELWVCQDTHFCTLR